jgi:hypothetical protein
MLSKCRQVFTRLVLGLFCGCAGWLCVLVVAVLLSDLSHGGLSTIGKVVLGRGKGKLVQYVEGDEHLNDFEGYMP